MSPKINHRRKVVRSEEEAEAWLNSRAVPKKARREGIVERAEGADGTIVLSVSWETRPFNPDLYVMNDWLESVLTDTEIRPREHVYVEDLQPGDVVAVEPYGQALDQARIVTEADDAGVTLDNGTHLKRNSSMYSRYGFNAERRKRKVGRFPEHLKGRVEARIEAHRATLQRVAEREKSAVAN